MSVYGSNRNPTKGSTASGRAGGIFVGIITRVEGGVYVAIPSLNPDPNAVFGPCKVIGQYPIKDQQVLCSFLENRTEEVVILGKQLSSNVLTNVGTPTSDNHAATKKYVDDLITVLQGQINTINAALTALTNRYNSHSAHPPPA